MSAVSRILSHFRDEDVWIGYIWAIVSAAMFHTIAVAATIAYEGKLAEAVSGSDPFMLFLIFGVSWISGVTSGLIAVLPTFIIVVWVAGAYNLRSLTYYVLAGIAMVMVNTPLFVAIAPPVYFLTTAEMSYFQKWWAVIPYMLLSGIVGMSVFWWKVGQYGAGEAASVRRK